MLCLIEILGPIIGWHTNQCYGVNKVFFSILVFKLSASVVVILLCYYISCSGAFKFKED